MLARWRAARRAPSGRSDVAVRATLAMRLWARYQPINDGSRSGPARSVARHQRAGDVGSVDGQIRLVLQLREKGGDVELRLTHGEPVEVDETQPSIAGGIRLEPLVGVGAPWIGNDRSGPRRDAAAARQSSRCPSPDASSGTADEARATARAVRAT